MKKVEGLSNKILVIDNLLMNINKKIEEMGNQGVQAASKKKYRPTNKTLEKLSEPNENLEIYVKAFSPFFADSSLIEKNIYEEMFKKMFPFQIKQIMTMELETKKEIIKHALVGLRKTFRCFRRNILAWDVMFKEDYEEDKLKFMVEHQKEPTVYEMDEYFFIEDCFVGIMDKAMRIYLSVEGKDGLEYNYLGFQTSKDLMVEYHLMLLEKKLHICAWFEKNIIAHYERKIASGALTENNINLYLKANKCLFTELVVRKCEIDMRPSKTVFVSGGLSNTTFICEYIQDLSNLIKRDSMDSLVSVVCNYLERVNEYFVNESVTQFSGAKRKEIVRFLEVVPTFMNYMKKV